MPTIFKYNNKLIQCMNLQKKLKKLKLSEDNIEIIWLGEATQDELEKLFVSMTSSKKEEDNTLIENNLHYFLNIKTNEIIGTVYNNIDNYPNINKEDWEEITYEKYKSLRH